MQLKACVILIALLGQPWQEAKQALRDLERVEPMADEHRWQGATGDWALANNWASGEIPGSGDPTPATSKDNVIFDGLSQQSPDTNLDRVTVFEFSLKRVITTPAYSGNIGATGNPLFVTIDSNGDVLSRVIHRGTGQFHFKGNTGDVADVLVDSTNAKDAFFGDGSIRNLFVKNGRAQILSTGFLTNYVVCDGPGAHLIIDAPAAGQLAGVYLIVTAGVVENARVIDSANGTIIVMGGTLIQTGAIVDGSKIFVGPEGQMVYNPDSTLTVANDNVDLAAFGSMDVGKSFQDIQFDNMIIGSAASMKGTPVQSGARSPLSTNIDLREEYP